MLKRLAPQLLVARLLRRVEDDAHVHHDVNEQAIIGHEGTQVLSLLLEAQRQGATGFDDNLVDLRIAGQVIPALPGRPEEEAQIVHVAIGLAVFDQPRIVLGFGAPVGIVRVPIEQPELAGQEPFAPVRPCLAAVLPLAADGVHGKIIGVRLDQVAQLLAGKIECGATFSD